MDVTIQHNNLEIVVDRKVVDVVLDKQPKEIVLNERGPAGADGETLSYTHNQTSPSASWTVNHSLGQLRPLVAVYIGANEVEAQVIPVDANQLMIYFASPQTGSARCI